MNKVLITGSGGVLGGRVKSYFDEHGTKYVEFDIKYGQDIFDEAQLVEAMEGCTVALHMAAYPSRGSAEGWDKFKRLNHEGSIAVFDAAVKARMNRFVYISSGNVYCFGDGLQDDRQPPIQVTDTPDPEDCHPYPRSKLETEVWLKANRGQMQVVILRPNHIAPTPYDVMTLWRGATITRERLVRYFHNACVNSIRNQYIILDVIEPTENYPGSLKAQELLD